MCKQTMQLPTGKNVDIITKQIDQMDEFQVLKSYYVERGFEFIYSRAQVFMTFDNTQDNVRPSLLLIIPSLVPVDLKADPGHNAVGIAVFINGDKYSFVSTEVSVNHAPYAIENYTLRVIANGQVVPVLDVKKSELAESNLDKLTARIVDAEIAADQTIPSAVPSEDLGYVIKASLSNFLSDEFTQQYPDAYRYKMLEESSLVEKFSLAIAGKQQGAAAKSSWSCSSTCCNGCTTCSCSWSGSISISF